MSNAALFLLMDKDDLAYARLDGHGRCLSANQVYCRFFGHDELSGGEILEEWQQSPGREIFQLCQANGEVKQQNLIRGDTTLSVTALLDKETGEFHLLCKDVSLRSQAEETVREKAESTAPSPRVMEEVQVLQTELEIQNEELRSALGQLELLKNRYAFLFQQAPVGYVLLSPEGTITRTNDCFRQMLQVEESEAGRALFQRFLHPDLLSTWLDFLKNLQEIPGTLAQEFDLMRKDGATLTVHIQGEYQENTPEDGPGYFLALSDITERLKAERERQELRNLYEALIEALPLPVYYKDVHGKYLGANEAFENFAGKDSKDFIGKRVESVWPGEMAAYFDREDEKLFQDEQSQQFETFAQDVKGQRRNLLFHKAPFYHVDGRLAGLVGCFMDMTAQKRQAEELYRSKSLLQSVFDAIPDLVFVLDRQKRICMSNWGEWENFLSQTDEEGVHCYEILHRRFKECEDCPIDQVFERAKPVVLDEAVDFGGRIYEVQLFPIQNSLGHVDMVVEHFRDITEHQETAREIQESEQRFRDLIEYASDSILVLDDKARLVLANRMACEQLGYGPDILEGMEMSAIDPTFSLETFQEILKQLASVVTRKAVKDMETFFVRQDGVSFPVACRLSTLNLDGMTAMMITARDISESRKAQAELKAQMKKLEKMNEELEEFSYVASHDLQEPLRTLTNYCELLKTDLGHSLNDDSREDIQFIRSAASRMQKLVQDLLTLSRAGRKDLHMGKVDLNRIVENCRQDLSMQLRDNNGQVLGKNLPTVRGDESFLHRLFQNLISNALKFKRAQAPHVTITSRYLAEKGQWEISVRDNGIGMEEHHLEQIFAPFKRLHGMGQYEGTGIGLAVCRKIVERHGGQIRVESTLNKGSVFRFTLPEVRA